MSFDIIWYAKVDGPPRDWHRLKIWDLDRLRYVDEVIEANADEGWVLRYSRRDDGRLVVVGDELMRVQEHGRFAIDRPGTYRAGNWTGTDGRSPWDLLRRAVRERLWPGYDCEDCIGMREHGCQCMYYEAMGPGVGPTRLESLGRWVARAVGLGS